MTIRSWPIAVALGAVVAAVVVTWRGRRLGYSARALWLWAVLTFPASAVGALALPPWKGLSAAGAMLGALAFTLVYIRVVFREPPWRILDLGVVALPIGLIFARVGCLLNGCCFGQVASGPMFPFTLRHSSYAEGTPAHLHHAAQAPELLWNLPLLLVVVSLVGLAGSEIGAHFAKRRGWPDGTVFLATVALILAGRLAVEQLRAPANPSQWALIGGLVAVLIVLAGRLAFRREPV